MTYGRNQCVWRLPGCLKNLLPWRRTKSPGWNCLNLMWRCCSCNYLPKFKKKIWTLLIDFISHGIVWIVKCCFSLCYKFGLFEVEIEVNCFHAFRKTVLCLPMLWLWSLKFDLKIMSFWSEWSPSSLSEAGWTRNRGSSPLYCRCFGGQIENVPMASSDFRRCLGLLIKLFALRCFCYRYRIDVWLWLEG